MDKHYTVFALVIFVSYDALTNHGKVSATLHFGYLKCIYYILLNDESVQI